MKYQAVSKAIINVFYGQGRRRGGWLGVERSENRWCPAQLIEEEIEEEGGLEISFIQYLHY